MVHSKSTPYTLFITYSVYSVFGLTDILDWIKAKTGRLDNVDMISLFEPSFLNVKNLPEPAKLHLQKIYADYAQRNPDSERLLQPIISQMTSEMASSSAVKKCLHYTRLRDRVRKISVENFIPGFLEFYSEV